MPIGIISWNLCWEFQAGIPGNNPSLQHLPRSCGTAGPNELNTCATNSARIIRHLLHGPRVPDFVCFQEVERTVWAAWSRAALPSTHDSVVFRQCTAGGRTVLMSAVVYRKALWESVSELGDAPRRGPSGKGGRVFECVRFRNVAVRTLVVEVWNVQGWHGGSFRRIVETCEEIQRKAPKHPERRRPTDVVLIAGDMNVDPAGAPGEARLFGRVRIKCAKIGNTCCLTDTSDRLTQPFDKIWYGAGSSLASVNLVDSGALRHRTRGYVASDHKPVAALISVRLRRGKI